MRGTGLVIDYVATKSTAQCPYRQPTWLGIPPTNRAPGFTNRTTELTALGELLNYVMLRNGERRPVTAWSGIC